MSNKNAPGKQRVLVVDDHGISRRFTVAALRQNNCSVKAAVGVAESVDEACAWLPEVIFTDWHLADGLGEDVVRGVRNRWPRDQALPRFVLITGEPPCACGAFDRVLIKPCAAAALAAETRAGVPTAVKEAGDESSREIHQLFAQELERRLPELDALIADGRTRDAASISHQLIASSAMCGQQRLAAAFRALDSACREQAGADTLAQRWSNLAALARDYLAGI
ncbi:MAG: response regulator [Xanthomonadales bacterium]|nr:response regulator [Xanthomonadales bacterium]